MESNFLSGAPRGHDLRGRVVLFRIPLVTSSDILGKLSTQNMTEIEYVANR